MLINRQFLMVLLQGVLINGVFTNEDSEIPSVSFTLLTKDNILGEEITQLHNITAIGDITRELINLNKGDFLRVSCKLVWGDVDYDLENPERQAELFLQSAQLIQTNGPKKSYHEVIAKGFVYDSPEYTANMHGSNARFALLVNENIEGYALEQLHSMLALNKLALQCKDFVENEYIQAMGKLLWLDGKNIHDEYDSSRSCEIVLSSASKSNAFVMPDSFDHDVEKNLTKVIDIVKNTPDVKTATLKLMLNSIVSRSLIDLK